MTGKGKTHLGGGQVDADNKGNLHNKQGEDDVDVDAVPVALQSFEGEQYKE